MYIYILHWLRQVDKISYVVFFAKDMLYLPQMTFPYIFPKQLKHQSNHYLVD